MANNLTGAAALAYQGTNAASPSNITVHRNRPTANFYQGFSIGDFWVYRPVATSNNNELWVLMGVAGNVANWVLLSTSTGAVLKLQGNTGGPVGPTAGVINIVGAGDISVAGNPGTSTLTISLAGGSNIVSSLTTTGDGHVVTPTAGTIIIAGGAGITTTGTNGPNTVTISTSSSVATSYITNPATGTAVPAAGVLTFAGGNNITMNATGSTVTTNVSGTTNHALQVGNSTGSLTSLAAATNGQIPIGSTGANPSIATITAGTGISVTNGAGSITIAATNTGSAGYGFLARGIVAQTNATGNGVTATVNCTSVVFDTGSNYDGTNTYTCPVNGVYMFGGNIALAGLNSSSYSVGGGAGIFQNGSAVFFTGGSNVYNASSTASPYGDTILVTAMIKASAGDTVTLRVVINGGAQTISISSSTFASDFWGCLLFGT
jgi:hypothetical protein